MPKGQIEALSTAIIDTNTRLTNALEALSFVLTKTIQDSEPLSIDETSKILGIVDVGLAITRSNQAQLQTMLEEAYEKGV